MTTFGYQPGIIDYWMFLTDWRNGSFAILLALGVLLVGYAQAQRSLTRWWLWCSTAIDLPQQLRQSKALHPRVGTRGSPIKAVILTGAEIAAPIILAYLKTFFDVRLCRLERERLCVIDRSARTP